MSNLVNNSNLIQIAEYFDSIAEKWDLWEDDLEKLNQKFKKGLEHFGVKKDEYILEVGCGTGNLTKVILEMLSCKGNIVAIDLSKKMIEIARRKNIDKRVKWICGAVENLLPKDDIFHRIICYSIWPHLQNPLYTAKLFYNLLKKRGKLHIWHLKSKEEINEIHRMAHPYIKTHILKPASETAELLIECGFDVEEIQDDDNGYLVTGIKK